MATLCFDIPHSFCYVRSSVSVSAHTVQDGKNRRQGALEETTKYFWRRIKWGNAFHYGELDSTSAGSGLRWISRQVKNLQVTRPDSWSFFSSVQPCPCRFQ